MEDVLKKKIITFCAAVLFLTALGLTLYPLISNYVNQTYASEIQTAYQELIQQTDDSILQEAKQRAIAYSLAITPGTADAYSEESLLSAAENYDNQLNIAGNGIMGYSILGGDYSVTHPFGPEVALLCREGGRESGLEWNRALYNGRGQVYDVIAGTFLVAGMDGDKITSLPDDLANKYNHRFQTIEVYAQVGDRTVMFQVPQDNLSDLSDRDLDSILRAKLEKRPSLRDRLNAAKEECDAQTAPERDLSHTGPER